MNYGSDYKFIPATSIESGHGLEVLPRFILLLIQIVNICFVGNPHTDDFVLVDAGMPKVQMKLYLLLRSDLVQIAVHKQLF